MGPLDSFPKPICAVCNREVEYLRMDRDLLRDETIFVVRCHGAQETATVESELFVALMNVEIGQAFTAPGLPAAPKLLP